MLVRRVGSDAARRGRSVGSPVCRGRPGVPGTVASAAPGTRCPLPRTGWWTCALERLPGRERPGAARGRTRRSPKPGRAAPRREIRRRSGVRSARAASPVRGPRRPGRPRSGSPVARAGRRPSGRGPESPIGPRGPRVAGGLASSGIESALPGRRFPGPAGTGRRPRRGGGQSSFLRGDRWPRSRSGPGGPGRRRSRASPGRLAQAAPPAARTRRPGSGADRPEPRCAGWRHGAEPGARRCPWQAGGSTPPGWRACARWRRR